MSTESVRRRRIDKDVSVSEMLRMRNDGMSNADIAKSLEISHPTVLKYIGKQVGRAPRIKALSVCATTDVKPKNIDHARVQPELSGEMYSYSDFLATIDYTSNSTFICVRGASGITIQIEDMTAFAQFVVSIAYKGGNKNAQ